MNSSHITALMALNANLQIAHWQADTYGNTHKAIGDLYGSLTGLLDDLAEVHMGKTGSTTFPEGEVIELRAEPDIGILLREGLEILNELRASLKQGEDDDLLNIVADMSAAVNKAKYLLKE